MTQSGHLPSNICAAAQHSPSPTRMLGCPCQPEGRRRTRSNSQAKQTKSFIRVTAPIVLPWPLRSGLEAATWALFDLGDQSSADFLGPTLIGRAPLMTQLRYWQPVSQPAQENKRAEHRVGDNRLPQGARRRLMAHERDTKSPKNK